MPFWLYCSRVIFGVAVDRRAIAPRPPRRAESGFRPAASSRSARRDWRRRRVARDWSARGRGTPATRSDRSAAAAARRRPRRRYRRERRFRQVRIRRDEIGTDGAAGERARNERDDSQHGSERSSTFINAPRPERRRRFSATAENRRAPRRKRRWRNSRTHRHRPEPSPERGTSDRPARRAMSCTAAPARPIERKARSVARDQGLIGLVERAGPLRQIGLVDLRALRDLRGRQRNADRAEHVAEHREQRRAVAVEFARQRQIGDGADRHEQEGQRRGLRTCASSPACGNRYPATAVLEYRSAKPMMVKPMAITIARLHHRHQPADDRDQDDDSDAARRQDRDPPRSRYSRESAARFAG